MSPNSWFLQAMPRYRRMLGQVLVALFFWQPLTLIPPQSFAAAGEKGAANNGRADPISTNDIDRRGAELRAALEANYKKLVKLKEIQPPDTDTTDIVTQYIPVGTKFSEAEDVLRAAGFHIERHPNLNESANPNRSRDWYAVLANISPFASHFPFRVDLGVELLPKAPGDYTDAAEITATFFLSGP